MSNQPHLPGRKRPAVELSSPCPDPAIDHTLITTLRRATPAGHNLQTGVFGGVKMQCSFAATDGALLQFTPSCREIDSEKSRNILK
jgi:hypothetical protein